MIQFINKLLFSLIAVSFSYMTLAAGMDDKDNHKMNNYDAHLMTIASKCAYKIDDKDGVQSCFSKHEITKNFKFIDSYIATSRLGIDAFYWAEIDDKLILAFRGTLPPPSRDNKVDEYFQLMQIKSDWLNDADIQPENGRHKGFSDSWNKLKNNLDNTENLLCRLKNRLIAPTINDIKLRTIQRKLDEGKILLITGHSKGAALATLAAVDIANNAVEAVKTPANNIYLYTFEGPRVFTSKGVEEYARTKLQDNHWRFEYGNDIVPHLPPGDLLSDKKDNVTRSTISKLAGFDIKEPQLYEHVGELKYRDANTAKGELETVTDDLKLKRLRGQLEASKPNLSAQEIMKDTLEYITTRTVTDPLSLDTALKLKDILSGHLQSNIATLINDHDLRYWEDYFKQINLQTAKISTFDGVRQGFTSCNLQDHDSRR